jgi:nitrite reductase/ring-hydroxylating ferredoxin subunit
VLFRTEKGSIGVLDAFCPHMGTHLGHGGVVRGNTVVCPYHEWRFDTSGKLAGMPFGGRATAEKGAENCNTRAYRTIERHGMIFAWIDSELKDPEWFPEVLERADGMRAITSVVSPEWQMHCMEPSHNTCDWYHFRTVHSAMGQSWMSKLKILNVRHEIKPARSAITQSNDDDGKPIANSHLLVLDEVLVGVSLWNGLLELPRWMFDFFDVQVRINGPCLVSFNIRVPMLGLFVIYMPITPTAPFETHVEYHAFADRRWPWIVCWAITKLLVRTVEQDREVWEHRMHGVRNAVRDDYDYDTYFRWLDQFYGPSSIGWDNAYEDLTW